MSLPAAPGLDTEVTGSLLSMPALSSTCAAARLLSLVQGRPALFGLCRAAHLCVSGQCLED